MNRFFLLIWTISEIKNSISVNQKSISVKKTLHISKMQFTDMKKTISVTPLLLIYMALTTPDALGSPLLLHRTSFPPPPSERPSLPKQSPPAQSAHVPLTAVAISAVPSSAHITPAGAQPSPFALPSFVKGCAHQSSRTNF